MGKKGKSVSFAMSVRRVARCYLVVNALIAALVNALAAVRRQCPPAAALGIS
jgi:hypothetical protein